MICERLSIINFKVKKSNFVASLIFSDIDMIQYFSKIKTIQELLNKLYGENSQQSCWIAPSSSGKTTGGDCPQSLFKG